MAHLHTSEKDSVTAAISVSHVMLRGDTLDTQTAKVETVCRTLIAWASELEERRGVPETTVIGYKLHDRTEIYRRTFALPPSEAVQAATIDFILTKQLGALSMNWYIKDRHIMRLYSGLVQAVGKRKKRFEYVGSDDSRATSYEFAPEGTE